MSSDRLPFPGRYVATIGVFDGVHRGHRSILEPMVEEARRRALPSLLFTFQPRPVTVFAPGTPPDELTPAPRKWRLLAEIGIDRVVVLCFSAAFARIEAESFLSDVLGAGSGLEALWIGHDFRFGHDRRGDWEMLQRFGERLGFRPVRIGPYMLDGSPVSSTRIRERIRVGEIGQAARLLGRWPDLEGTVVTGRGEGKRRLVATANLELPDAQCLPPQGVYAGEAEWDGRWRPAVLNLGRRPTLTEGRRLIPEVHVLDFEGELLGRRLQFRLRNRLREERKFAGLNELREQIGRDLSRLRAEAQAWKGDEPGLASE